MICVDNKEVKETDFISLLEKTKQNLLRQYANKPSKHLNGNLFEDDLFYQMKKMLKRQNSIAIYSKQEDLHFRTSLPKSSTVLKLK